MRKISLSAQWLPKALTASVLAVLSMPAYSLWIDTPNVRDGLRFGAFVTINPQLTHTSNKFTYTLGDPRIYGTEGTIAQVLADQDRKDSDGRLRGDGVNSGFIQLVANQALTKDLNIHGSVAVDYNKDGYYNYGALWGLGLEVRRFGSFTVGDGWTRLPVKKTDATNIIQNRGTNVAIEYTAIPNLTLAGYHMFTAASDVNNNRVSGWHRNHGVAAEYVFDFAPRKQLTVAAGAARGKGHQNPYYVDTIIKGTSYMGSVSYQHNDLTLAVDYGKGRNTYNGIFIDDMDTTVFGAKATYEITPRIKGTLSYAREVDDNSKPISLDFLIDNGFGVDNWANFPVFDKTIQDRYKVGLDYQLYSRVKLSASVEKQRTRNYVTEGEFSQRDRLYSSVGASFGF
ncbi:MAG: hypothetical protein Q4D05_00300 [Acinetobacter sp.]|nr:hypothetical protein [Acinetobacter sp.]